uniref:Uncharacterized protein n=1 Tax=Strombidium rassoulzadegani TaxID=1082188 RepID=A0A7S3FUP3_9SPIT|mmetsp:Transcript_17729/g.30011  ORF Transcript_17729/g.30011 Transcript_17729/m.30011 type:complete len:168 (+) Transcript_17729:760-1263(+)
MVIKKTIVSGGPPTAHKDDDDEEDEGIPPEILEMMRITDQLIGGGPFGGMRGGFRPLGPKITVKTQKKDEPREDESVDEIMARMNKLSEEIGERHEKNKSYQFKDQRSQRFKQILMIGGVLLLLALVSFILTCRSKANSDKLEDEMDSSEEGLRGSSKSRNTVRKSD